MLLHLPRLFSGLNHPTALSLALTHKQQTDSVITIIFFPFSPASVFLLHSCFPLFEVMMNCLLLVSFFPQQTSGREERLRMCVAVKKKLQLYYWKDREFHELQVEKKIEKLGSLQCVIEDAFRHLLYLSSCLSGRPWCSWYPKVHGLVWKLHMCWVQAGLLPYSGMFK